MIRYIVCAGEYITDEEKKYDGYGIVAVQDGKAVALYEDLYFECEKAEILVEKLTAAGIELDRLQEAVELAIEIEYDVTPCDLVLQ